MATCRSVITRALQQARIVPLGRDPTSKEAEAGMLALQGIYDGWATGGMFGRLTDVYKTEDYEAQPGERVFAADSSTITRAATVEGDEGTRTPRDLEQISIHVADWQHWIWTGSWVALSGLTLDDEAPLSERDQEGLSSLLAIYLAEGFGESVGQMTASRGMRFQGRVSHKFGSTQDAVASDYF